ncbi:MarR family winged helix-turn-helix transcriptional regulator [Arthrobacter rhombi]|uniref:MarR family winged helix-turn-helix transcriptional regulator n=1 Tax=Arthrobacter rhombi TaxID=71253 RepID=UPI0031DC4482
MSDSNPAPADRPPMHPASVLLRRILVLNDTVEYRMRVHLKTNETDFQAMQHLLQSGPMTHSELAAELHLTTAAVTSVIDRLVRAGHVRRHPHPSDRRRVVVEPTESSVREAMAQLMPMIMATDALVRGMDHAGQHAVTTYLDGVVASMQDRIDAMASAAGGTTT